MGTQEGCQRSAAALEPLKQAPGQGRREQVCPMSIQMKAESYHALAMILDRLARFSLLVALDRMEAKAVRDDDAPIGLLVVDLRLAVPVLSLKAQ